jgi:aspartate/methionine/tyrosine aminotransferase
MTFVPFALEHYMSEFEQDVDFNLTESGVHPPTLGELLEIAGADPERLLGVGLGYPYVEGIPALRERIAALYPGASPEGVLVTVGAAEANYITTQTLLEPGDRLAAMVPNYLQVHGAAHNRSAEIHTFPLRADSGWELDVEALDAAAGPGTRLIAVCNPNNPTGHVMSEAEMNAVVAAADRTDAWILADEVYRGAERSGGPETPTFFGRYRRVVAVGSVSKAYGLPGLRIGWAVAPPELIQEMWRRHEYTTISATTLANHLAALALEPEVRTRLLERTRRWVQRGYENLERWMDGNPGVFTVVPPAAAAIAFPRYHLDVPSVRLAEEILRRESVLVVPGEHFGVDHHLRISFGTPPDYLAEGLQRMSAVIEALRV